MHDTTTRAEKPSPHDAGAPFDPTDLTRFRLDCLAALRAHGPTHGLDIRGVLDAYYDESVNHGRLYPNLDELAELGLVEKRVHEQDRRSHEYAITEAGLQALKHRRDVLAGTFPGGST